MIFFSFRHPLGIEIYHPLGVHTLNFYARIGELACRRSEEIEWAHLQISRWANLILLKFLKWAHLLTQMPAALKVYFLIKTDL